MPLEVAMDKLPSLVQSTLQAFGGLVSLIELENPMRTATVQSHLARFKLWTGDLGAHHTWGTKSLIYRLRDASMIRSHVVSLLEDLNGSIGEANSHSQDPRCSAEEERDNDHVDNELAELLGETKDIPGDGPEHDTRLARLIEQMGDIIDCLLRLSVTIKNAAPFDQFGSRVDVKTRKYEHYDIDHVREKFPKLDPVVRTRLGRALAQRRGYFKYREDQHLRLQGSLTPDGEMGPGFEGGVNTVASSIPQHSNDSTVLTRNSLDASSDTSETSYALSTHLDALEPDVPPVPEENANGPFLCPFCFMIISTDTRHDWIIHVFRDLRPYVCIWNDCVSTGQGFQKRRDWISHMTQEHWRQWDCPFECSTPLDNSKAFDAHLKSKHADKLALQRATEILLRSTHIDIEKAKGDCPLCWNFKIESTGQYASHVGNHLEQLALFALPKTEGHQEEDGKNKDDNVKHPNKIGNPELPDADNVNESTAGVKAQTSKISSNSGSSLQERPEEEATSSENATSQPGEHSELAERHLTKGTVAGVVGMHSENDPGQNVYSKKTEEKEGSVYPGDAETRSLSRVTKAKPVTTTCLVHWVGCRFLRKLSQKGDGLRNHPNGRPSTRTRGLHKAADDLNMCRKRNGIALGVTLVHSIGFTTVAVLSAEGKEISTAE